MLLWSLYDFQDVDMLCAFSALALWWKTFIVWILCLPFRETHLCHQNAPNMNGVGIVHQMSLVNQENGAKLTTKYDVYLCYLFVIYKPNYAV